MSRHAAAGQPPAEREPWYDPSIVLGSSGPTRVARDDDADPDYAPPRVLGFGVAAADVDPEPLRRAALGWAWSSDDFGPEPLLWEGDDS